MDVDKAIKGIKEQHKILSSSNKLVKMLKPSLEAGPGVTSHMSGPKSLMPLGHKDHRMPVTSSNTPASLFQSLPYIGNNQV